MRRPLFVFNHTQTTMDLEPVKYTLGFYLCAPRGYGKRRVPRRHQSDTLTSFDPLLFCEVYRCTGSEEFKWLMENTGKTNGYYGAVLIEGTDGSRRQPLDTDFISTSSPAPAVSSESSERLVPAGAAGAGDSLPKGSEPKPFEIGDRVRFIGGARVFTFAGVDEQGLATVETIDTHNQQKAALEELEHCPADVPATIESDLEANRKEFHGGEKQPNDPPPIDPPVDNTSLLLKIKNLLVEPIRVNAVAAQLGVTADEVKREVLKPDSGVELKGAGWLGLLGTV